MKILKPGRPEIQNFRLTCKYCGCEFECDRAEVKSNHDQWRGSYVWVTCPQDDCRHNVYINNFHERSE